jgi:hypothetical protein
MSDLPYFIKCIKSFHAEASCLHNSVPCLCAIVKNMWLSMNVCSLSRGSQWMCILCHVALNGCVFSVTWLSMNVCSLSRSSWWICVLCHVALIEYVFSVMWLLMNMCSLSLFYIFYHPSLFTICTSTFSKLVEGSWWVSWRRALISTLL